MRGKIISIIAALITLWVGSTTSVLAFPDKCIQALDRVYACPNLLYTKANIGVAEQEEVICICLADFKKYVTEPEGDTEKVLQRMELQDVLAHYQLSEEAFLQLIKEK